MVGKLRIVSQGENRESLLEPINSFQSFNSLIDTSFASGSIDGTIVAWSYQQDAWHQLWEYVDPKAEDKTFSTSIQAMLPLAEVP